MHSACEVMAELTLDKKSVQAIDLVEGTRIGCTEGMIWLTEQRPGLDVVLMAGESHTVRHDGVVVLSSRNLARVVIHPRRLSCGRIGMRMLRTSLAARDIRLQLGSKTDDDPGAVPYHRTCPPTC